MVQFYTFRHQLTASPRHEIETFGAKFIVSGTPFRYNCNENCSFCHQFGTKMALSGAILQPGTRMWALHARNYGGLVCEVSLFLLKITLKMLCAGCTKAGALHPWLQFAMGGLACSLCPCSTCCGSTGMLDQAFFFLAQTTAKAQAYFSHATPAHAWPCQWFIASSSNSQAGE